MIGLVLDGAPGLIPSLRPLSASAGVLIHDDAAAAWAMGLLNQVAPLNALKQQDVSWTRCIITMGLPTAVPCLKDGLNAETGGITGLQELAAQAAGMGIIPGCLGSGLTYDRARDLRSSLRYRLLHHQRPGTGKPGVTRGLFFLIDSYPQNIEAIRAKTRNPTFLMAWQGIETKWRVSKLGWAWWSWLRFGTTVYKFLKKIKRMQTSV